MRGRIRTFNIHADIAVTMTATGEIKYKDPMWLTVYA